jgi:hypothetical protein
MPPYPTGPSHEYPPRRTIIGGYVIDGETCRAWGSQIAGMSFSPEQMVAASNNIRYKLKKDYKTKFTAIGEDFYWNAREWMVVTQTAKFNGWKDMDPALIPQFEEGYREEIARQLLGEHGT